MAVTQFTNLHRSGAGLERTAGAVHIDDLDWKALIGKTVLLNSFGIGCVAGIADDYLLIGKGEDRGAIPLAAIHRVQLVGSDGSHGAPLEPIARTQTGSDRDPPAGATGP